MRIHIPSSILLLSVLLPLATSPTLPQERTQCGALLRDLAIYCSQPDRAPVDSCCVAIRAFNDAYCFCQPASFRPAVELAGDPYGFSARMDACNVTTPYARPVPSRDFSGGPDTCPFAPGVSPAKPDALGETDVDGNQCANPAELRKMREQSLGTFDRLKLLSHSKADVEAFRGIVRELFSERASLESIGLTAVRGQETVEDFLLARMEGLFAWQAHKRSDVIWPSPRQVSYIAELGEFRFRHTLVSFKLCSDKIANVFIVEHNVMPALGLQFYYPEVTQDAFTEYNVTPTEFCERVEDACGDASPYGNEQECIEFATGLKNDKRVLCNKFESDVVWMAALLGDTLACRYHSVLMARTNPSKHCPLVGVEDKGFCEDQMCPERYYGDMFGDSGHQRYESSNAFTCSRETGACTEMRPDEDATSRST